MSDAAAELQYFQDSYFACSASLRAVDEAISQGSLDQFQGFGNSLIQNKEPALGLFLIDRTPWRFVIDSTLGDPPS
jgi:hypothetical protein